MSETTTTSIDPPTAPSPIVLDASEGAHAHFLTNLATTKVAAGDAPSGISMVEFVAPQGFAPPLHSHDEEDECFYVLDGELTVTAGDCERTVGPGAVALVPSGTPHTFLVRSETARLLAITAGSDVAPSFDRFVAALGDPVDEPVLPPITPIDPGRVASVGAAHGIQVLGPPPLLDDA